MGKNDLQTIAIIAGVGIVAYVAWKVYSGVSGAIGAVTGAAGTLAGGITGANNNPVTGQYLPVSEFPAFQVGPYTPSQVATLDKLEAKTQYNPIGGMFASMMGLPITKKSSSLQVKPALSTQPKIIQQATKVQTIAKKSVAFKSTPANRARLNISTLILSKRK